MIPKYPVFKSLELEDRTDIAAFTARYDPYSDFNFVSLWSWGVTQGCRISTLHGNLVVRMNDYVSGEAFYSFLGADAFSDTAHELVARAEREGLGAQVRLVPACAALRVECPKLPRFLDEDGSDYVFSLPDLYAYDRSEYRTKRKEARRFERENPGRRVTTLDLGDERDASRVQACFERWADRKTGRSAFDLAEFSALRRLVSAAPRLPDLRAIGVFLDDALAAFAIVEILPNSYAMGHFLKADPALPGAYAFLMRELAGALCAEGRERLNAQQDLGFAGLRQNKESYAPIARLWKFTLRRVLEARP